MIKRLALQFSEEMRAEARISNFNLIGDLIRKLYILWLCGGRGYVPHYIPEGGYALSYKNRFCSMCLLYLFSRLSLNHLSDQLLSPAINLLVPWPAVGDIPGRIYSMPCLY